MEREQEMSTEIYCVGVSFMKTCAVKATLYLQA